MDSSTLRRTTGTAALIGAALTLIEVPLYFMYDGPPPDWNVFTRSLFGLAGITSLIVFMTGFGFLVKRAEPEADWLGALATNAGLAWLTVALVSTGLEVGAVIQAADPIDPTITVSGTYILYGTISRFLEALFFCAFGFAVQQTAVLPQWTARSAFVLAAIHLAFVPSLFFGNTPANFYAANGWGTTATMGGLTMLWLLAIGRETARHPRKVPGRVSAESA
ncbi:hypothetical protein GFY24_38295 [Nocardia sp. SYP-A9097]|uniref:hypothetical protein n=1 Tax=Nocardia sp. SYP-A9097 TaxID=2663237 RepID=UPI00129A851E|nr:hypothetical protein [Nocardia sp. SYP-A9097]MRH93205.1 hypothetical protein [Nocardia sp. SYP-A9097]